jgi:BirA family biotin operon repressor/biotin-[acetyl-CoA-carboxylase] ligase
VKTVAWRLEEVPTCDSTNTQVATRAAQGESEGLVLRADHQTAGRGRLGRTWEAPAGVNLLASLLFIPELDESDRWLVPATVALAARASLVRLSGVRPDLKWPNDLVVDDAKVAGLLTEVVITPTGQTALVVGIGVNLGWHPSLDRPTTSIAAESGVTILPIALLDQIESEVDHRRGLWDSEEGRMRLREEISHSLATLGRDVRVERSADVVEGRAVGLRSDGALEIATPHGIEVITLGDVVHLRESAS